MLGFLFVGLGLIGIFLPILPTTPFLLLASFFFARSSPRFDHWLQNTPWLGDYVRHYKQKSGVTLRTKNHFPFVFMAFAGLQHPGAG